ncbi:uncharacterized protein BX663DRAFT_502410 [Cokeromyces recurvatus]|uniref:uncharacterized protein n=1 Tax=Cokeromyces recurvatus TaxID=90255 RepID=UPI00221E9F28|nr:uncharacterized protein BX663DRAFT_502410 [Cokeromyces recurvatus]KAI7905304.1 hypothetical protein BX663DRAFT_502410 [Cokeromyces recurvatus]
MNPAFRLTSQISSSCQKRLYSSSANTTTKPSIARSGFIGFLLGVTTASAAGYYYLLGEYNSASASLLISVQELQASTEKVKDYARRIETIDRDVTKLKEMAATKQQLSDLKVDFRKLYDTLNIEHLELKTHVWGLEKDFSNNQQQQMNSTVIPNSTN